MFLKNWLEEVACLSKISADKTVEPIKVDDIFIKFRTYSEEVLGKFEINCVVPCLIKLLI